MIFYTKEEVATHTTKESCWFIAHNNVYNVTEFINRHPGGKFVILSKAGMDVTKHFKWHSSHAKELWKKYKIGEIKTSDSCCL